MEAESISWSPLTNDPKGAGVMEQAVFTTLCMVSDPNGRVLVQERVGTAFCGIRDP